MSDFHHDRGTADFITEIHVAREVTFGGFDAMLCTGPDYSIEGPGCLIFLSAVRWAGEQPLHTLHIGSPGYSEWRKLLDAAPEIRAIHRVVGSATAARNRADQWATHGPSPLLGKDS